jgi:hypothetical protein
MVRYFLLVALLWMGCSAAEEPVETFIYAGADSGNALDKAYFWRVLRAALDHTRAGYGTFVLEAAPAMPDRRQIRALARGEPPLTVGLFTASATLARQLVPVRVPVIRGLLGYRILLVRETDLARFAAVSTLSDLRSFRFGLLPAWDDAPVMITSGLTVVPGESYDGLFRMLAADRFDAFSRGVTEILPDYERARDLAPGLVIEPHLLLHYPLPIYFWFSPDEAGRRRAARVEAGLREMVADGSLQHLFDAEYGLLATRLDFAHRRVIELSNPLLDGQDAPGESGLWFHPHG